MNSCQCCGCKGKKGWYSTYYHREEGFDRQTTRERDYDREQILILQSKLAKLKKQLKKRT